MTVYYAASTGGFYDDSIHEKGQIPADAKTITPETHQDLLMAQSQGKRIIADERGFPVLTDPPPLATQDLAQKEVAEAQAEITALALAAIPDIIVALTTKDAATKILALDSLAPISTQIEAKKAIIINQMAIIEPAMIP
jgi:hypothetical protein